MKKIITFILAILLLGGSGAWAFPPMMAGGDDTLSSYTVATLPTGSTGLMVYVTDGASSSDCTTGSGASKVVCIYTGSAWAAAGSAGGVPTAITVANEATDTSCYPLFVTGATGDLGPKTLAASYSLNSNTGILSAAGFSGPLTGNVTGNCSGTAATVTGATQAAITTAANLTTVGALASGSLAAGFTVVGPALGGTGIANAAIETITIEGGAPITLTLTGSTNVTFPTSGTLATVGGNVATATALAADPADCAAGAMATAIAASGALTCGATWAAPGTIGSGTPSTGAFTTFSAGSGAMTVDADGDVVGKSFTVTKVNGTAGTQLLYEATTTETNGVGWKGPASRASDLYLQFADADPAANQFMLFPAPTTGTSAYAWQTYGTFGSLNITSTGYIAMGADPADAGDIRLPNAGSIQFEASPTGTDVNAMNVDSSEVLAIGSAGASSVVIGDNTATVKQRNALSAVDGTWSGQTLYFAQCAATMAFGAPAYVQSTGKPGLADADAAATMPAIGLVVVASTDADTPCTILTHGVITETDWNWTPGATIYVADGAAGALTATVGDLSDTNDVVQVVGIAIHADSILVMPSLTTIVLE